MAVVVVATRVLAGADFTEADVVGRTDDDEAGRVVVLDLEYRVT